MCVTCGCSNGAQTTYTRPSQQDEHSPDYPSHTHVLKNGTVITHSHDDNHDSHGHAHYGHSAHTHAQTHGTTLTLEQNLLAKNDLIAAQNRGWLKGRNITALNLVSSPGAGKTTLLVKTIEALKGEIPMAVIEGDQETANDAERIAAAGCPTIQVNTGTGCHLEAAMIERGLDSLNPPENSLVLIENVGNLVCPALFDLGEKAKVAMLSVTEGEDKPIKYPHMFRASQVMVLTKIDLLPYVNFNVQRCLDYATQVNPNLQVFQVSAISGEGLSDWYAWLKANCNAGSLKRS
jgi:hydrogenase nickel incorporation protein HypB